ncbi:MaoC/PaaZ C-terminal domain-containing protein [Paenibacillus lentus]|uniref:MaoC family dehydratase n=1 Tax=Paenibacillus lentus TaxID=1338368 RepID=UPI00364EC6F7
MFDQAWLGTSTTTERFIMTKARIASFLQGFPDPFRAEASGIPFTYPIILWQSINVPWLPGEHDGKILIHGQQTFDYVRALRYDEELSYQIRLANIREKKGSQGMMYLLDCVMHLDDANDQPVLRAGTTLLLLDQPHSPAALQAVPPKVMPALLPDLRRVWSKKSPLSPGTTLIDACLGTITGDMLLAYAKASNDYNAIHLDVQKANAFGMPRRVAHGMLVLGMVGNILQKLQTEELRLSGVQCRFHVPIMENDAVYAKVTVQSVRYPKSVRIKESADETAIGDQPGIHCLLEVFIDHSGQSNLSADSQSSSPEQRTLAYSGSAVYVFD